MENNITFKYSELGNRNLKTIISMLIGGFLGLVGGLFGTSTNNQNALIVITILLVVIGSIILLKLIVHIMSIKTIVVDSEKVEVKYKFLTSKNREYKFDDCIGYFCYSTMGINFGGAIGANIEAGIITKFMDGNLLKISKNYVNNFGVSKLDNVLNWLNNKKIKNFSFGSKKPPKDPYNVINYPFITDYNLNIKVEYKEAEKAFRNQPLLN